MNNEREALAWDIFSIDNAAVPDDALRQDFPQEADYAFHIAEGLIESGYRKPRTVTTRDEVLALHEGAVLLDSAGDVAQLRGGLWCGYEASPMSPSRQAKYIPATVLHEGEGRS